MEFILFGKTILVVNKKFGLFLVNQLMKRIADVWGKDQKHWCQRGVKAPMRFLPDKHKERGNWRS